MSTDAKKANFANSLAKLASEAHHSNRTLIEMMKSSGVPASVDSKSGQTYVDKLRRLLSKMLNFTKVTKNAHVFLKKKISEANKTYLKNVSVPKDAPKKASPSPSDVVPRKMTESSTQTNDVKCGRSMLLHKQTTKSTAWGNNGKGRNQCCGNRSNSCSESRRKCSMIEDGQRSRPGTDG